MENTAHILGRVQDGAGLKCVGTSGNPIYIKLLAPTLVSKQIFSQRKISFKTDILTKKNWDPHILQFPVRLFCH